MKKDNAALKTKQIMDSIDETFEQISKYFKQVLNKFLKDLKNVDGEINFEFLFQFIVKLLFLLFGFILLKIPFDMAKELGNFIFEILISPLNILFIVSWKVLITVFYLIVCFGIFVFAFKKYFKTNNKNSFLSSLIRISVSIFILFPAWCLNFTFLCSILFLIYLLIKGINLIGLLFIFIGASLLLGFAVVCIKNLLSKKNEISIIPFLINLGVLVIGGLLFARDSLTYEYYKTLEDSALEQNYIYEMNLQKNINIESPNGTKEIIIDNTLENNQVKINITYYDSYNIRKEENRIIFYTEHNRSKKEIFNLFLKDLKNKKIYNYSAFNDCNIKIYVNENTREFIN